VALSSTTLIRKTLVMVIAIYIILMLACSFTLCIFGFFVGRCARKVPILDNNLPRVLHRGQVRYDTAQPTKESAAEDDLLIRIAAANPVRRQQGSSFQIEVTHLRKAAQPEVSQRVHARITSGLARQRCRELYYLPIQANCRLGC
jgi:hypothetical protein